MLEICSGNLCEAWVFHPFKNLEEDLVISMTVA